MADAFTVLRRDHEKVERMLSALEDGPNAAAGADQASLMERRKLTQQLIIDESGHEAVEERYFWPVVRDRIPAGNELADEAVEQEQQAKHVLAKLDKLEAWDDGFDTLLYEFIAAARQHVTFEETKVWPALRQALNAGEIGALGDKLLEAKKSAPTRPHPHTPPDPSVLKAAGPAVAAADKLRDSATGRGAR